MARDPSATRTLSEIVDLTGAKRRSIQLWADAGIIHPVKSGSANTTVQHPGSGTHRRFAESEVVIAALLTPLAELGVPIGWLHHLSRAFREALAGRKVDKSSHHRDVTLAIRRALANHGKNYLAFTYGKNMLFFHAMTDLEKAVTVNLAKLFDASLDPTCRFIGLLDLNMTLRRFHEA